MKSQVNWKEEYEKLLYVKHQYHQLEKNFKQLKEENKKLRYENTKLRTPC